MSFRMRCSSGSPSSSFSRRFRTSSSGRVPEKAADQVANRVPAGLLTADHRLVAERAALVGFGVGDVALLLQDPQGGQDGVIGEAEILREGVGDFGNRGCAAVPQDIHQPEFRLGEIRRSFAGQRQLLQLKN